MTSIEFAFLLVGFYLGGAFVHAIMMVSFYLRHPEEAKSPLVDRLYYIVFWPTSVILVITISKESKEGKQ